MKRRMFLKVAGGVTGGVALGVGVEMIRPTLVSAAEAATGAANGAMPLRTLGRTGFKISVAGFSGFALMRGDQEQYNTAVHKAFDRGLNYYDVAPAYDKGKCEENLGVALQGLDRSKYFLACKTKMRDKAGALEELERSLTRLKTDHFDVYQMHHLVKPEDVKTALGPGGAMETFLKAKDQGKIRAIGFSAHTTKAALEAMRGFNFDTVMFPINYMEYFTRDYGKEVLAMAKEKGMGVISIKTIHSGAWPANVERKRKYWYRPLEEQEDINLAYRWTLSLPGVVVGFPPAWLDLQEKAITAGLAYRPATEADDKKLREMAVGCGSIFKKEEDSVAWAPHDSRMEQASCYPDHPYDRCPGDFA
ncbi:MAG: aldo/keto reductase [Candidatus Sumerlaeota bacterium]|nr:aldo/keto reductase [Candidatus Sumerlaeota bacterium]